MIVDTTHPMYIAKWKWSKANKYNGAYYYSREIIKYFVPVVGYDRHWLTVNVKGVGADHSIVFIHNNLHPENYSWLSKYDDLILVCGLPETMDKVRHLGTPVYLPLSIDTDEVRQYQRPKDMGVCYAGRMNKRRHPANVPNVGGKERSAFLSEMARYEKVYAIGRCALEAKVLGCEILPYDERFPDPSIWNVVDSRDSARKLKKIIEDIDGK